MTTYTFDGLGNQTRLVSPDTGTATSTFDAAGNVLGRVDARGVPTTYTYDWINRATQIVFSKTGLPSETHAFTYDLGANAKGKLTQATDPAATTSWTYNGQGRIASKTQVAAGFTKTIGYGYNSAGQLAMLTTPSGQQIGYTYANNRVSTVTVNGSALVISAGSEPFGPLAAWQWGNGLNEYRDHDTDGRLAAWDFRNGSSLLRSEIIWDDANRITVVNDPANAANKGTYQYDSLDRLTVAQRGNPVTSTQQFGHDAVGNRTTKTVDSALTNYTYPSTSNQLQALSGAMSRSYVYDGAGNPTAVGGQTYTYNLANRLVAIQAGATASYAVNALGQRVTKIAGGVTTLFVYDEQGRLLGEYDGNGELIQETVWLEDLPIATLRPTGSGNPPPIAIHYVHADHLGSPRAVTRASDSAIMWRWDNIDPFGANVPNENPTDQGTFKYNLRFPGQYYDAETGLVYNMARDHDSSIGRYVESDPIGLKGGVNTYAYSVNRPIDNSDPSGLDVYLCERSTSFGVGNHSYFYDTKTKKCCGRVPFKDPLSDCKEPGPPSHFCVLISTSDDVSKQLFDCCGQRGKEGVYRFFGNDCQTTTDDCIRDIQRAPPPGINRFGSCNSCWRS